MEPYIDFWSHQKPDNSVEAIEIEFEAPGALDGANILFAVYTQQAYEGEALIVFERDGKLWEVNGSH